MLVIMQAVCLFICICVCGNIPNVVIFCLIQEFNHIIRLENTLFFFVNHFSLLIRLCYHSFIES